MQGQGLRGYGLGISCYPPMLRNAPYGAGLVRRNTVYMLAGSGARGTAGVVPLDVRVQGSGFRVWDSGFRVRGSRFRVHGLGFRVQG